MEWEEEIEQLHARDRQRVEDNRKYNYKSRGSRQLSCEKLAIRMAISASSENAMFVLISQELG